MFSQDTMRLTRRFLILGVLVLTLVVLLLPATGSKSYADAACCDTCDQGLYNCQEDCIQNAPCPGPNCATAIILCYERCDNRHNFCINACGDCN
jgi:hypothetical protein